jgi:hypothetical protein
VGSSTAELTLIIRAQNLAEGAFNSVKTQMTGVVATAKIVASDMATAFKGVGKKIGAQLGNIATDILSGGSLANNMVYLGATMAGAVVEGLSAHLLPMMLERLGKTALFAPLAAAIEAGGVTLGTVLTTAIGVGMAAAPFVLLAAAVAALVYLAVNPKAREKAREIGLMIIGKVGDGLHNLGVFLIDIFKKAVALIPAAIAAIPKMFQAVFDWVLRIAKSIVARVVGAIKDAIAWVQKLIGNLGKVVFPTPQKGGHGLPAGSASGGWVGMNGPEVRLVGEAGPEYVVPNHRLGQMGKSSGGFTIQGISEREIVEMVDRGLYFRLQRSGASRARI